MLGCFAQTQQQWIPVETVLSAHKKGMWSLSPKLTESRKVKKRHDLSLEPRADCEEGLQVQNIPNFQLGL